MARTSACLLVGIVLIATVYQAQASEVARSIELGTAQLHILSSSGEKLISNKGGFPSKLLSSPQITSKQTIEVSLTVASGGQDFKPQQVFLSLQRMDSSSAAVAYAVGKPSKKDSGYVISAPASIIASQIGNQGGEYKVSLLVGDVSASAPISWDLGIVELVRDAADGAGGIPPRTTKSQPVTNQLPVIQHIFRAADKRPPAVVSLVFTALVLVPLAAVLVYVIGGVKANTKAWPRDSATSAAAAAFHIILSIILGVYLLFWTTWNLAETLPVVLGLGLLLAISGHKALSGVATARFANKKD